MSLRFLASLAKNLLPRLFKTDLQSKRYPRYVLPRLTLCYVLVPLFVWLWPASVDKRANAALDVLALPLISRVRLNVDAEKHVGNKVSLDSILTGSTATEFNVNSFSRSYSAFLLAQVMLWALSYRSLDTPPLNDRRFLPGSR
jgi:hypothetical protein